MAYSDNAASYAVKRLAAGPYLQDPPVHSLPWLMDWHPVDGRGVELGKVYKAKLGSTTTTSTTPTTSVSRDETDPEAVVFYELKRLRSEGKLWSDYPAIYSTSAQDPVRLQVHGHLLSTMFGLGDNLFTSGGAGYAQALDNWLVAAQISDPGSFSLPAMDALRKKISSNRGHPHVFLASANGISKFTATCYGLGFAPPTAVCPLTGCEEYYHGGIPILRDDGVKDFGSPPRSSMYAVVFGWGHGFVGLFPAQNGMIQVQRVIQAGHQGADPYEWEGYRISLTCQTLLFREKAAARLDFTL